MTATAVFALTACGGGSDPLAENSGDAASGGSSDAVTVGSADFPESQVIAELYAGVLRDAMADTLLDTCTNTHRDRGVPHVDPRSAPAGPWVPPTRLPA